MKVKKFEEVNYIAVKNSINRDFKILSAISIIMTLIAAFISLACMKLALENEALKEENNELRQVIEMKDNMISDLQEDNIKLQEMIK